MFRYVDDLYPRTSPRDGARIRRITNPQAAHFEDVRNGTGAGQLKLRGTSADAQALDPRGMQYVRKVRIDTSVVDGGTLSGFDELVVGGYWLEQGDFLALDRKRLRTLEFGGAGVLGYLDRAAMAPRSYLNEALPSFTPQDPFDDIWRLYNQGLAAGGDFLGAVLWRVITEALNYRSGATYTHKHAGEDDFGEVFTDSHDNDRTGGSAIALVTLGFDQFEDTDGNPWSVGSGEFTAQVGESVYEVVKRLMEAGLYVEMDPDTFELRAWEVANHGRDRTGTAWGTNVVRFQAPSTVPSTDRTDGNILNDLKRAIQPFIRATLLWAGGNDTYVKATQSGDVRWERYYPSDVVDEGALAAVASRQITARNDAGDTIQVRAKVGKDPANGYYLPAEHARLDDLVTVATGTDTWDWDDAAYPLAGWSVTSRRTGAPDVFYSLGASYHSSANKQFTGAGVGRHTHGPNPELCRPGTLGGVFSDRRYFGNVDPGVTGPAWSAEWDGHEAGEGDLLTPTRGTYGSTHQVTDSQGGPDTAYGKRREWWGPLTAEEAAVAVAGGSQVHMQARTRMRFGIGISEAAQEGRTLILARFVDSAGALIGEAATLEQGASDWPAQATKYNRQFGPLTLGAVPGVDPGDYLLVEWGYRNLTTTGETSGSAVALTSDDAFADLPEGDDNTGDVANSWIDWFASGATLATVGDGHPALIGAGKRAKRCSDTEHFFSDREPTVNDDFATAGMRYGTHWVLVDDLDNPTESFGTWMLIDPTEGAAVWIQISSGTAGTSHTHDASEIERPVVDHDSMGAAETFDASAGQDHEGILDDDLAVTLAGATDGEAAWMTLKLTDDGNGPHTITWPGSVIWPGGVAPDSPAASESLVVSLFTYDGGTTWYGAYPGVAGAVPTLDVTDETTDVSGVEVLEFDPADFDVTDEGSGVARVSFVGSAGGGGGLPLTAVVDGVPELVWDENNNLIGSG